MTDTGKQTALFFGFLTAAMTAVSAQAAPAPQRPADARAIVQVAERATTAAPRDLHAARKAVGSADRAARRSR